MSKQRRGAKNEAQIFNILRARIGEEFQRGGLEVKPASPLEMAIGTFAPSELVVGFKFSDYPFIGSRYISVRDGHVYIVAGATDDGEGIMAYRMGFLQSSLTHRGGIAVGISADGWMDSKMIMYALYHAAFSMKDGELNGVSDDLSTRRTYPLKKCMVYWEFLKNSFPLLKAIAHRTHSVGVVLKKVNIFQRLRRKRV